jgi:soluble lytic murein transglycosylase-like protein
MSALTMIRAACEAAILQWLALVAACLLFMSGNQVAAQAVDAKAAIDISVFTLPDEEGDVDVSEPSLQPPILKALTPADLPPSNPLVGSFPRTVASFPRTSVAFSRDWRAGRNEYRELVEREARAFGLPPALVDAIMAVESRYNPASIGLDGEIGLMQVMPPTARMLGFSGSLAELAAPEINVHYGTKYLAGAWRLAGGDLCTAAMKYRAGHGETRFSFLSVDYCLRVRSHLAANGVAVSGPVPQPTFGRSSGSSGAPSRGRSISGSGTVNFAALNTRLRALTDRKTPNASN